MISVIIPTRRRLERTVACIREFNRTTGDCEVIVVCDGDREALERLQQENCKVLYQEQRGAVSAWNLGLKHSSGQYVVLGANDLRPQDGWAEEALRVMRSLPDGGGLVGLNTGDHGESLATHFMVTRRFIKSSLGGVLATPHYRHCFVDNEANERAKRAGRFAYAENSRLIHDHPSKGKREVDECDRYVAQWFGADQATFEDRKARGFPDDFEAVI